MHDTSAPTTVNGPRWTIVVAISLNNVIGRGDQLPWRLSSDLQRFKRLTMGQCLLMGRKTFQSIGRPLPGRQTIVLSRTGFVPEFPEVSVVQSLSQVPGAVQHDKLVMVVGGAEVYKAALGYCDQMWITRVLAEIEGDVYFPVIDWTQWRLIESQAFEAGPRDQWPTQFERWQRN